MVWDETELRKYWKEYVRNLDRKDSHSNTLKTKVKINTINVNSKGNNDEKNNV